MKSNELVVSKDKCTGCEACVQMCGKNAILMQEDIEGFRYPVIDESLCINCGLCKKSCPIENSLERFSGKKYAFGGYITDKGEPFPRLWKLGVITTMWFLAQKQRVLMLNMVLSQKKMNLISLENQSIHKVRWAILTGRQKDF